MGANKKLVKALTLFLILAIPSIAYILISTGKNNYRELKKFGPHEVVNINGNADTVFHTIPSFSFIDQTGEIVTEGDFENTFYVADFFFCRCKGICIKMSTYMMKVQDKYKDDPDFKIISHTVDPEHDSVPVLAEYAEKYNAIEGKWHLVTGKKQEIYELARTAYLATATEGDGGPEDFIHSQYFSLIDPDKRIRGLYDGTDPFEIERLIDEIAVLKYEYKMKNER